MDRIEMLESKQTQSGSFGRGNKLAGSRNHWCGKLEKYLSIIYNVLVVSYFVRFCHEQKVQSQLFELYDSRF